MTTKILKRGLPPLFISLLLQHFFFIGISQPIKINRSAANKESLFVNKHIDFTLIPLLTGKASITKNKDKYQIHSTSLIGFEAGFSYYLHFDNKYSLIAGIFFGAYPRNFNYSVPGNEFIPPVVENLMSNGILSREFNFAGSLPILIEKRWFMKNDKFIHFDAGLTFKYTTRIYDSFIDYDYGYRPFFNMDLIINENKKIWLNYIVRSGYSFKLKNKNLFKTNLILNKSYKAFVTGNYKFNLPNQPLVEGTYKAKGSYIGLSFSYVLTGAKKIQKINNRK